MRHPSYTNRQIKCARYFDRRDTFFSLTWPLNNLGILAPQAYKLDSELNVKMTEFGFTIGVKPEVETDYFDRESTLSVQHGQTRFHNRCISQKWNHLLTPA